MIPVNVYTEQRAAYLDVKQVTYAEHQEEYQALPCAKLPNGDILTRWQLTKAERRAIADNCEFYLCVKTFNQPLQPLMPFAVEPDIGWHEDGELYWYVPEAATAPLLDDSGLPEGFRDCVYTDTDIQFSFWDKVKILFGWKVRLEAKTYTENRPGNLQSESTIRVYRHRKLPEGWGVAMEAPVDEQVESES